MDDVIGHSRKPVVCRYFAASGTCFYGNDCQFLHSSFPRSNMSPTFPLMSSYSSASRSGNSVASSSSEVNCLPNLESNSIQHSYGMIENKSSFSNSIMPAKDEYIMRIEELSISPDLQIPSGQENSSLFEVGFFFSNFVYSLILSSIFSCLGKCSRNYLLLHSR